MKNAMFALLLGKRWAIALGSAFVLVGCSNAPLIENSANFETGTPNPAEEVSTTPGTTPGNPPTRQPANPPTAAPTNPEPPAPNPPTDTAPVDPSPDLVDPTVYPERGQITELQMGDLMCYTTIVDANGQMYDIGAAFEICSREAELLNQPVMLTYSLESVADCQSAEPCGRTREELIITEAVPLGESWETWSNGTWTVTVGRLESWDGGNHTGNLTYYGCDDQGNCLSLDQGFTVCRFGLCSMSWENGSYVYALKTEMTEGGEPGRTTLVVRQGEAEILRAENMQVVASSQF